MIRCAFYLGPDGSFQQDTAPEEIGKLLAADQGLVWVDFENPSHDEAQLLADVFRFHPLAIDDCTSRNIHHPKVDEFEGYLFVIVHGINYHKRSNIVETTELALFLGDNYVVSSHKMPLRTVDSLIAQTQKDHRSMERGADFLAHRLIDSLVDDIMPTLEELDERSEDIEARVLRNPKRENLPMILRLKRSTLALRRVMTPQREVMNSLSRGDYALISEHARIYYRDIYDHLVRIEDFALDLRDMADSVLNTYLSSVSNRMNEVMKVLTVVATVFIPLTFIVGVYGMNFDVMPELHMRFGYYVVWAINVGIAVGLAAVFRWRRWI